MRTTIVIVGHGRSPEGRGWGLYIDTADVVIRMWDWGWQATNDYGDRFDFGLTEACPMVAKNFVAHRGAREPRHGWIASMLNRWWESLAAYPPNTEYLDQAPWNAIATVMGGVGATGRIQFTRGTIAALWAITRADRGDEVILVGFDDIWRRRAASSLAEAFSDRYRQNAGTFPFAGYRPGVTKMGNHDYAIERPLMERMAAEHGIALRFAQEVWA